jgi:hypothetical protein
MTTISKQHITTIKHARKSFLFNNGNPSVKRNNNSLFDVTMGCFDGAEICELVGLYILNNLPKKFGKDFVGLYRDDGLALIKGKSGRVIDSARKDLCKLFRQYDLGVTLDLKNKSYQLSWYFCVYALYGSACLIWWSSAILKFMSYLIVICIIL